MQVQVGVRGAAWQGRTWASHMRSVGSDSCSENTCIEDDEHDTEFIKLGKHFEQQHKNPIVESGFLWLPITFLSWSPIIFWNEPLVLY